MKIPTHAGALDCAAGRQHGRRVEADSTWTIYHVFSGVPASVDGRAMTGLSRADATDGMLAMNLICAPAAHRAGVLRAGADGVGF